MTHTEWVGT